ncbi:hypothetical protein ACFORL_01930 [Legionella dresdenensis]|uniref:Uncharacterized protein n=1 Tax=Legionella dresdenensis TaxID=450200 RepID=A0ABV8CC03_9GAMM
MSIITICIKLPALQIDDKNQTLTLEEGTAKVSCVVHVLNMGDDKKIYSYLQNNFPTSWRAHDRMGYEDDKALKLIKAVTQAPVIKDAYSKTNKATIISLNGQEITLKSSTVTYGNDLDVKHSGLAQKLLLMI